MHNAVVYFCTSLSFLVVGFCFGTAFGWLGLLATIPTCLLLGMLGGSLLE